MLYFYVIRRCSICKKCKKLDTIKFYKLLFLCYVMLATYFIILTGYTLLNCYKGLKIVRF